MDSTWMRLRSAIRSRSAILACAAGLGLVAGEAIGADSASASITMGPGSSPPTAGAEAAPRAPRASAGTTMDIGGAPLDMRLAKIGRLKPGRGIRVWLPEGNEIDGRFVGSRRDTLVIEADRRLYSVPLHVVDVLWIRQRATARGAKIGAISGTLAGGAFGTLIALLSESLCDTGDCGDDTFRIIGGMTILGAAGGAALGVAIGSQTWQWDRRYEGKP